MGGGIAENLRAAGFLHAVWDARDAACARFPAVPWGLEKVADCDIILLAVPGSAQIGALFDAGLLELGFPDTGLPDMGLPDTGLPDTGPPDTDLPDTGPPDTDLPDTDPPDTGPTDRDAGRVLVDLTTSDPGATARLAARAAQAGAAYLDAGMSGGAAGAAAGQLTLMIGGAPEVLARIRPVLDRIAAQILHVGPSGAGHTMKLVHNMICHTIFLATTEGCRAAARAGIPLESAIAAINAGNARSFVSERRFPDHIISGEFDGRSVAGNLAKDLSLASALFDDLKQPSAYVHLTAGLLAQVGEQGLLEQDFTRLFPAYDALVRSWKQA